MKAMKAFKSKKMEFLKQEVNMFVRNDDDTPKTTFCSLKYLVVSLKRNGCEWANDAFIVSKFLGAMIPLW